MNAKDTMKQDIVLSGMRPTGALHLGHYYGALVNWRAMQDSHQCYFMVADHHALTTHYQNPEHINQNIREMVIDWLACGLDPARSTLFVQSWVPQHAELFLMLSMITPIAWLERVPTYKEQMEKLADKDLTTYGFLGYPLLQAADILVYGAHAVPVGEDQLSHVELTREIARRFNHFYGRDTDFEKKAKLAEKKLIGELIGGHPEIRELPQWIKQVGERGDSALLAKVHDYVNRARTLTHEEKSRLFGALRGGGRAILSDPQAMLTKEARLPGLDGQKMSKSYGNALALRESDQQIDKKIRAMKTDPARQRRTDAGNPKNCPVWAFHQLYSSNDVRDWVMQGCTSASIGCIECKAPVIEAVIHFVRPIRERAEPFINNPEGVDKILAEGSAKARATAESTMREVRAAVGLKPPQH